MRFVLDPDRRRVRGALLVSCAAHILQQQQQQQQLSVQQWRGRFASFVSTLDWMSLGEESLMMEAVTARRSKCRLHRPFNPCSHPHRDLLSDLMQGLLTGTVFPEPIKAADEKHDSGKRRKRRHWQPSPQSLAPWHTLPYMGREVQTHGIASLALHHRQHLLKHALAAFRWHAFADDNPQVAVAGPAYVGLLMIALKWLLQVQHMVVC